MYLLKGSVVSPISGIKIVLKKGKFYILTAAPSYLGLTLSWPEDYWFFKQGDMMGTMIFVIGDIINPLVAAGSLKTLHEKNGTSVRWQNIRRIGLQINLPIQYFSYMLLRFLFSPLPLVCLQS
ncbi:MAG: hypothetical protein QXT39_05065 [Conexivisphaerales archaeon]